MIQVQCHGKAPKMYANMNSLERAYAAILEQRKAAGEIAWWEFESVKLKLADNMLYIPDFEVMFPDGRFEFHETKGFWRDDARCKIKMAATRYWMFTFKAFSKVAKKNGGGWKVEEF